MKGSSVEGLLSKAKEYIVERQSSTTRDNAAPEKVTQRLEGLMQVTQKLEGLTRAPRGNARVFCGAQREQYSI